MNGIDNLKEISLSSEYIFKGNILNLRIDKVELPDKNQATREIIEHSGGVTILPITTEGEIIMVKQHRIAPDEELLELPAGKLEIDEDIKKCAIRELQEETGYKAESMEKLFSFYTSPGYSDELLHLYLADPVYKFSDLDLDDGEFIEVKKLKPDMIMDYISKSKIKDSKTIIGLMYYLHNMK